MSEAKDDGATVGETNSDVTVARGRDGVSDLTGTEFVLPVVGAAEWVGTTGCLLKVNSADDVAMLRLGADVDSLESVLDHDVGAHGLVEAREGAAAGDVASGGVDQAEVLVDLRGAVPVGRHVLSQVGFLGGRNTDGHNALGAPVSASDGVETVHLASADGLGADVDDKVVGSDDVGDGGEGLDLSVGTHVECPDVVLAVGSGGADTIGT